MATVEIEKVSGEPYCRCERWRKYRHVASEHAYFEAHAELLTPRRWKREQQQGARTGEAD